MRSFPLGLVLTGTTGMMMCDSFGDFQEMVEYLLDRPVFTHELIAEADNIKDILLEQHPYLRTIEAPELDRDGDLEMQLRAFLASVGNRYRFDLPLMPKPESSVRTADPLTTLVDAMKKARG